MNIVELQELISPSAKKISMDVTLSKVLPELHCAEFDVFFVNVWFCVAKCVPNFHRCPSEGPQSCQTRCTSQWQGKHDRLYGK